MKDRGTGLVKLLRQNVPNMCNRFLQPLGENIDPKTNFFLQLSSLKWTLVYREEHFLVQREAREFSFLSWLFSSSYLHQKSSVDHHPSLCSLKGSRGESRHETILQLNYFWTWIHKQNLTLLQQLPDSGEISRWWKFWSKQRFPKQSIQHNLQLVSYSSILKLYRIMAILQLVNSLIMKVSISKDLNFNILFYYLPHFLKWNKCFAWTNIKDTIWRWWTWDKLSHFPV